MISSPDPRLSSAQRDILDDERPRILVAAGAGSGKTRLLVAYFLKALLQDGIPLERLAAVTFTKKAAGELLSRIRESLYQSDRADLARSLDGANIGTIHGLCSRLLRSRAIAGGVDPAFTVLEAEAASLLKEDVRSQVWAEAVEQASEAQLDVFARDRRALESELVPLYERLRGLGMERPAVTIAESAPTDQEAARARVLGAVRDALSAADRSGAARAAGGADRCVLEDCVAWLARPQSGDNGSERANDSPGRAEAAAAALEETRGFFPSRRSKVFQVEYEEVRSALTAYRRTLVIECLRPMVAATNDLLARFHERYTQSKRERGLLDFSDLELRARALVHLRPDGDSPILGPRSRLMVDEFQDTNELQCSILEGLRPESVLMVGDERQSIYRFRGADVDVFARRQAELSVRPGEGTVHRLDVSYRARPEVLEFINRLFAGEGFFGPRHAGLTCGREGGRGADDRELQRVGSMFSPAVEVLCANRQEQPGRDETTPLIQMAEAETVADRVHRLVAQEKWEPRDIVVLLPALTHVGAYQKAMAARRVPTYVVRGKGYYAQEEISDVRALLGILVNPHDDLAFLTVLRSPMVGLSDDALFILGQEAKRRHADSLWDAAQGCPELGRLKDDESARLSAAVSAIASLAASVGRPGLSRLIDRSITEFDYDLCLLGSPEGRRCFANVRKLMRLADEFEAVEGPDLAGFVRLIDTIGELSDDEGNAPTLAEDENVVRVMSVHQAKGLEFPVVVVAGLGSGSPGSKHGTYVIGHDGRMAVIRGDSRREPYETEDLAWGPAGEILEEDARREREEDVRLMYVAMTRAQERLFLVGARPRADQLEGCRLGRIAAALGLTELPSTAEVRELRGLDAMVVGVAVERLEAAPWSEVAETSRSDVSGPDASAVCPVFFEPAKPGLAVRSVSFSSLAAYRRCPREYYLERVLGLDLEKWSMCGAGQDARFEHQRGRGDAADDDARAAEVYMDPAEAGDGREIGLLVHQVLERLSLGGPMPGDEELQRTTHELLEAGGYALSSGQQERATELARSFWRSRFAGRAELAHAVKEVPFLFAHKETMVSGVMDLAWRDAHSWQIVDYKTNRLRGRTAKEVGSSYNLQAKVYALALLLSGAAAVSMHFLFLEKPEEPYTLEFTLADEPALRDELDEAFSNLMSSDFSPPVDAACEGCRASGLCPRFA